MLVSQLYSIYSDVYTTNEIDFGYEQGKPLEIYVQDQFETAVDDWMFKGVDTYLEAGEEFAKGQVEIDGQRKEVTLFGEGNFYIMN